MRHSFRRLSRFVFFSFPEQIKLLQVQQSGAIEAAHKDKNRTEASHQRSFVKADFRLFTVLNKSYFHFGPFYFSNAFPSIQL